ncbi:centromere protein I-like [Danaus plexippus]|uniref:centromere protein I-like n=1 Tax=Danaus plexippus TaxID=13037 RepID=UPI002AB10203|nr:centromere protein I-like [Danaus plexippus]XP_061378744.1 centromere protein I-like [Danaus plexippus]
MTDVEEIIDYIKSLKKGFDKELFQSKIDELGSIVENTGLKYEDFHTLFKVWLNLNIPITKWVSFGTCLVPQEKVNQNTVEYSLRWILANYENQNNFSRIGFLLDWLTAAMDSDSIDMNALDMGYELFYIMLTYEMLTGHAMKLVYTLTKPADVTRGRVLELIEYAKKREAKKNMYRQIQVLLGLFKSFKPECVPEDVPCVSIYTAFKKINVVLMTRFKNSQSKRHVTNEETFRLFWVNPLNEISRNKKADPLIPNMEFANIGSKQYKNDGLKNYLDFSDPVSLLQYSSQHVLSRPARLRALLCNPAGLALLATHKHDHAFLSHDLQHLLDGCFLEQSPHSYIEKQDLLHRLALFQSTVMQGVPVVTRFLAQYLPFWNEKDYFSEIMELIQWLNVDGFEDICIILDSLSKIYQRAQPLEQCAISNSLNNMFCNLVFSSSRSTHHFLDLHPSEEMFAETIYMAASKINDMCDKALQVAPGDLRVVSSAVLGCERRTRAVASISGDCPVTCPPPSLLGLSLPLLDNSAAALDNVAAIIMMYKKIFSSMKSRAGHISQRYKEHMHLLKLYTADFVSCFYEQFLSNRNKGIIFSRLHPQLVNKLIDRLPGAESQLSVRNHLALAPYTYVQLEAIDHREADNRLWFDAVVAQEFGSLSQFIMKAMPEMR